MNWNPLWLSLQLACCTTLLLAALAIPLAHSLSSSTHRSKPFFEALISLPLVLPPTVIGFYLLLVFSPTSWIGSRLEHWFGLQLAFSFTGLLIASLIYSLPFMVHPIQNGLAALSPSIKEAAYTMGRSNLETLCLVLLPSIRPALLTGLVLTFAHTLGEFGIVLMIGGNIPGETRVASIALYEEVEALRYSTAHQYALVLLVVSFLILLALYSLQKASNKKWG